MKNILWELVVPELWENDESGLILANKEDVRNGVIPLLVGGWSSGSDMCPPKGWIPYSDVLGGRSIDWDEDEDTVLFLDEIHIVDQAGNQKLILVPPGLSTHFYACGVGIYRNSEKVVFLNVSPHTWCGIKNVSLATVDFHSFSITLQPFDEPDFICSYLERLTGCTSEDPSSEIYSWSNGEVEICLCEHGDKLLIAAESPAVTLEMNWNAGRWKINGHKNGRCVPQNEAFYLQDINGRP